MTDFSQGRPLFLRTLSLYGITKWARKYYSPILILFKNKTAQYTIYFLNIYSSVSKDVPVSVFKFFCFFPKYQFFIFTSQKSSRFGGKSLCIPLINRVSIKYKNWVHHIFILSIFFPNESSKSHNFNIWKKNYSFHYGQQNRPSSKTWQTEQKATWHNYQNKTEDMSWYGGYEFILRCLIDVKWK